MKITAPVYDKNNIFAKIIRSEIPAKKIFEDDKVLAFYDRYPIAPIHILVIPKGEYINYCDFITNSSAQDIYHYFFTINSIIDILKIRESGFKLITNQGKNGGQEIFHFHTHIIGGKNLKN